MKAKTLRWTMVLCVAVALLGFQAPCDGADCPVERFKFDSGAQLEKLINDLNDTPEAWQAGVREVPRLYITNISARWRDKTAKDLDQVLRTRSSVCRLTALLDENEQASTNRRRLPRRWTDDPSDPGWGRRQLRLITTLVSPQDNDIYDYRPADPEQIDSSRPDESAPVIAIL